MSCVYAFWELKICGINDGPLAENRPWSVEKMQNLKNERSEKLTDGSYQFSISFTDNGSWLALQWTTGDSSKVIRRLVETKFYLWKTKEIWK